MKLLIVRHGPAGDKNRWAKSGRPDAQRPLTPKGRGKMRQAAKGLRRLSPALDLLATSPLARAKQTAEIVRKALKAPRPIEIRELEPDAPPQALARWLAGRKEPVIAVVGHEPHLGRFIAWICTRSREPLMELKKGQCALLDVDVSAGRAKLLWSLKPAQLRLLAR